LIKNKNKDEVDSGKLNKKKGLVRISHLNKSIVVKTKINPNAGVKDETSFSSKKSLVTKIRRPIASLHSNYIAKNNDRMTAKAGRVARENAINNNLGNGRQVNVTPPSSRIGKKNSSNESSVRRSQRIKAARAKRRSVR